jgi:vancomycin permeability regulator SanA
VSGRRVVRRTAVTVFVVGLIAGALLLGPAAYVRLSTASSRYAVADVPAAPVAIVFGAGIRAGEPSPFLRQRLDIAVELFRTGKVLGLLMTGDHGRSGYDEVGTMAAYVVERGVPSRSSARTTPGSTPTTAAIAPSRSSAWNGRPS